MVTGKFTVKADDCRRVIMDLEDYEVIDEVELEPDFIFQSVKFPNGYYGVKYVNPIDDVGGVTLVTTEPDKVGVEAFMRFARMSQMDLDVANADRVELCIFVDPENREVYREAISGSQAKDITERLKIAEELKEMKYDDEREKEKRIWQATMAMLMVCVIANAILIIRNLGGI